MRIRFRTDRVWIAEAKGLGRPYDTFYGSRALWNKTPAAEPGDTWRCDWARTVDERRKRVRPKLAGYLICCPRCREVHGWTTASNCSSRRPAPGGGFTCEHSGVGSCWTWTGSAEQGTLSASPSLHASNACGWHGWLHNGDLHE